MVVVEELGAAIDSLKRQGRISSNLYSEDILHFADEYAVTTKTVLLSYVDHTVRRLYYCTLDIDDLPGAVSQLIHDSYVLEFMTREYSENRKTFSLAGFSPLAALMRMSVRDCSTAFQNPEINIYYDGTVGQFPEMEEAPAVNRVLWHVFDTRVSHLCSDDEIAKAIQKKEITVHKGEAGKIDAVLQTVVNPKKFYINQVYNGAEKRIIHAMLLNRLKEYCEAGGKYAYAWVAEDNIASVKFHRKYGFTHDGMWNMVYSLEK